MKFKFLILVLSLSSVSFIQAAERNLCDDLIDSGTSSPKQIENCLDVKKPYGIGPSEYYKEQAILNHEKVKVEKAKEEKSEANQNNLIVKKFTKDELFEAGFGKPFYAIRGDYRNHKYKSKRITEGDALCSYLGYEKALKSTVDEELWENKPIVINDQKTSVKVDMQGLVIDTNFLGVISKKPEMYHDEDFIFTVRPYKEITCIKRKDKSVVGSDAAMKVICEDLVYLNESVQNSSYEKISINNGTRSTNGKTEATGKSGPSTPNGYVRQTDEDTSGQSK